MQKDRRDITTFILIIIFAVVAFVLKCISIIFEKNNIILDLSQQIILGFVLLFIGLSIYTYFGIRRTKKRLENFEIDQLTYLYNLRGFDNDVRGLLKNENVEDYYIARIEIDKFKLYNEIFGLRKGDEILKKIANKLKEFNKRDDVISIGHAGADHFLLCIMRKDLKLSEFSKLIEKEVRTCTNDYQFNVNIGYAQLRDLDITKYCEQAYIAIQSIKESYDRIYAVYTSQMTHQLLNDEQLLKDAQIALEKGYFKAYFQPQYLYHENKIIGAEALIRWIDPIRGMIYPNEFIPVLERNGFIYEVDKYTWNYVCKKIKEWKDAGIVIPCISINISRRDLYHADFVETLVSIIKENGIDPSDLHLEITESAIMENPNQFINILKKLKQAGFYLEMDDFGSGYSALNSLKDLPFDLVKLDMCFMSNSNTVGKGGSILSSIVRLLSQINTPVIAEGVETKAQAEFLKSIGCYYMQGYYFSKPLSDEEFIKLVKSNVVFDEKESLFSISDDHSIDFLDDRTQSALLFNSFVGGAFILEYRGDNAEIIRTNARFLKELDIDYNLWSKSSKNIKEIVNEESYADFINMLTKAIESNDEADAITCAEHLSDKGKIYCHIRSRFLAKKIDTYIFYCTAENITKRLEDEEKVRMSENVYRAVANQSRLVILRYYINDNLFDINIDLSKYNFSGGNVLYPDYFIEKGFIRNKQVEVWNSIFENIKNGIDRGNVDKLLLYDNDNVEHYFNVNYRNLISNDEKQNVAVIAMKEITKQYLEEQSRITEYNAAFKALNKIYSVTIACNLTNNSFYLLNNSSSEGGNFDFGTYDDLFNIYIKTIPYEEDRKAFRASFERNNVIASFAANNKNITLEHRHKGKDNIEHWMETSIISIENKDSDDVICVYASRNIDEIKKNAEIARIIKDQEANHHMIGEVEESMVDAFTKQGKIVLRYDVKTKTLITPASYAKKQGVFEVRRDVPNKEELAKVTDNELTKYNYQKMFDDIVAGVPHGGFEGEFIYADGSKAYEKVEYSEIFDENGKPIKAIISIEDVTTTFLEKIEAQKQVEKLRSLIDVAVRSSLEYIILINTIDNTYTSYATKNNELIDSKGVISNEIERVAKYLIDPSQKEEFERNANFATILKQLETNNTYSFIYDLKDGKREATFYHGRNENEIVLTVANIQDKIETNDKYRIMQSLINRYISVWEFDLDNDILNAIYNVDSNETIERTKVSNIDDSLKELINLYVCDCDKERVYQEICVTNLREYFSKDEKVKYCTYFAKDNTVCQLTITPSRVNGDKQISSIVMAIESSIKK